MSTNALLAISTFPGREIAEQIVRTLLDKHLIACGNVLPQVRSLYQWKGNIEESAETLVLFKLSAENYDAFEKELRVQHPYEVPEIIAFPITQGLPDYLNWIAENSRGAA